MARVNPPLAPAAELAMLRTKYPDGLWCTSPEPCEHRLLATTAAGWSKSWAELPEPERLARRDAYVCAERRTEAAERQRVAAVRAERAAIAGAASVRARAERRATQVAELNAAADPHKQRGFGGRFLSPDRLPEGSRRAGGRPKKHADLATARRAARSAYRKRKKAEQVRRNDGLIAGEAAA